MIKKPNHINKPWFKGIKITFGIWVIASLFRRSLDGYFSFIALILWYKIEGKIRCGSALKEVAQDVIGG